MGTLLVCDQERKWSDYQCSIFQDVIDGAGHTIVLARAGSGKTTVLVEAIRRIPNKRAKVLAVAFNKKIQIELEERIDKSYITCRTLHSLGLSIVRESEKFKSIKIVPDKTRQIIYSLYNDISIEDAFLLEKTVNYCKSSIIDTPSKIDQLIDDRDIYPVEFSVDEFISATLKVLRKCKERKDILDYGEMVWFPIVFNLQGTQYDYVFVDELQDLTTAQIQLAISSCKKDGRIFAFGDDLQAIYGWNNVDINTVFKVRDRLNAKTLSLPISYRCPNKVIELAKEFAKDIKAAPDAKDGRILNIKEDGLMEQVKVGDFVLSRSNAPLIKHCMLFLRNNIKSNIQGKDLGDMLRFMIKKSKKKTVKSFLDWLKDWRNSEVKRLQAKKRSPTVVYDKYDCLVSLCEDAKSLVDVEERIKELFNEGDDAERVIFSNIHQCKGLQRKNVFLLRNTFRPDKDQEEANLLYIGITRTMDTLYFVEK